MCADELLAALCFTRLSTTHFSFSLHTVKLEQYPSSPHLAAHILYTIDNTFDDIRGKVVVDLGCGGGILGLGASLLGAGATVGIDIDPTALAISEKNAAKLGVDNIDFFVDDVIKMRTDRGRWADTVIMNPPFGTKTPGVDMRFVEKALEICSGAVYSLHKTSTRDYVQRKSKELGVEVEFLAQLKWDIPHMYKFHRQRTVDVEVREAQEREREREM
jgi:predicted RNA methylase